MTLGEYIAAYRKEHGLSQRAFGRMCHLSNGYISMLEKLFHRYHGFRKTKCQCLQSRHLINFSIVCLYAIFIASFNFTFFIT